MAMEADNPAVSYETQTNTIGILGTLVESFLDLDDDDRAYGSTVIYVFANSAAASSFTSEYPFLEQLSAAATTTYAAQMISTTIIVEISMEQRTTVTAYPRPTSSTSSSTTRPTLTSPTSTPYTTSPTIQSSTNIGPASPLPSSGLSSSAKAGIGISASLGALSLALLVFLIYRYLKHKQRSRQMHVANIPPIPPSPSGSALGEAENRLPAGSEDLGPTGYGVSSTAKTPMKESTDGLASPRELNGVSALTTPRELSGMSTVEHARDLGVRSAMERPELA